MNKIRELKGPSLLVLLTTVACDGKLIYDQVNGKQKMPYILFVSLYGLLYTYATYCLSNGACNLLSWVISIIASISILTITGIFSDIPLDILIKLRKDIIECSVMKSITYPETRDLLLKIMKQ
jgi:hypothetical protein